MQPLPSNYSPKFLANPSPLFGRKLPETFGVRRIANPSQLRQLKPNVRQETGRNVDAPAAPEGPFEPRPAEAERIELQDTSHLERKLDEQSAAAILLSLTTPRLSAEVKSPTQSRAIRQGSGNSSSKKRKHPSAPPKPLPRKLQQELPLPSTQHLMAYIHGRANRNDDNGGFVYLFR